MGRAALRTRSLLTVLICYRLRKTLKDAYGWGTETFSRR